MSHPVRRVYGRRFAEGAHRALVGVVVAGRRRPVLREVVPVLRPRVRRGGPAFHRSFDPHGRAGQRAGAFLECGARLCAGLRQGHLEGDGAGPAAGVRCPGAAAGATGCGAPWATVVSAAPSRAACLGVPGMMCTCCAAPVVVGLRKHQASPGASIAFWLGNTMLNPATLVFTGFVLGWHWTALRMLLGVPMVFGLGYLANRMSGLEPSTAAVAPIAEAEPQSLAEVGKRWVRIFTTMTLRLIPEYLVIVLLLGAARAWMFPHIGPEIGEHWYWIAAFAVAGMLFVIPTAGEVPHRAGDARPGHGRRPGRRPADDPTPGEPAVAGDAGPVPARALAGDGRRGGGRLRHPRRTRWRPCSGCIERIV